MFEPGIRIRFRGSGERKSGRGVIKRIYRNFILVDAGNYYVTVNKADVIDRYFICEVKINKIWVMLNREMVGM